MIPAAHHHAFDDGLPPVEVFLRGLFAFPGGEAPFPAHFAAHGFG
jgi:hypothetical protein